MITQRMMVRGIRGKRTWDLTFNTEAVAQGEKTVGIPFNLYGLDSGLKLTVHWGDGTTSFLTPADYEENDSRASVHEYTEAGVYDVGIYANSSDDLYVLAITSSGDIVTPSNANVPLYYFRRNLVAIHNALPRVKGVYSYFGVSSESLTKQTNMFYNMFVCCASLSSIPEDLFSNNPAAQNFSSCFRKNGALDNIPDNLFSDLPQLSHLSNCFRDCTSLGDFEVNIVSPNVVAAADFVTVNVGATRTIYVPSGSTTETTFNSVASDLGLTIVGE